MTGDLILQLALLMIAGSLVIVFLLVRGEGGE